MIGFLRGAVVDRDVDTAVIDVGGVGYDVYLTIGGLGGLPEDGIEVCIYTHTHVREDALQLFGFLDKAERLAFRILIGISGIGPKGAMHILGGISAPELCQAVLSDDLARLKKLPGVGKKTAERLMVELRDKVDQLGGTLPVGVVIPTGPGADPVLQDLRSALLNLGYRTGQVDKALTKLGDSGPVKDIQEGLRSALALIR
jgi:Holliday junction DNA helicase RuvA